MRRQGTRRLYRTRPEGLEDLRRFLESFWDEQLRLLKHEAETEERHAPLKCLPRNIPSLGNLP